MMNTATPHNDHQLLPERPTLVVGLGLTGWSVVRHLATRGVSMVVTDSRDAPPYLDHLRQQFPDTRFAPGLQTGQLEEYQEVVASPGIKLHNAQVVGDIELFAREARSPVIAITGSNGKSTVTSLVGVMLEAGGYNVAVGGNIGTPALDLLENNEPDWYVLELSSFQLETTSSLSPRSATVLNISEDHMDRYDDLEAYRAAKLRVYKRAARMIFNRDDPLLNTLVAQEGALSFGLDRPEPDQFGVDFDADEPVLLAGDRVLAPVASLTLQGRQNVANVLAAFALIEGAGIALTQPMIDAAMSYEGLAHRCELVGNWNGVKWINDSKGTNVGATLAAINGSDKPLILIAGGQGKGADFTALGEAVREGVRAVVLIGEDAARIEAVIPEGVAVRRAGSLQDAINKAREQAESGDTVLFSPACASFDMFRSFADRGDQFRQLVIDTAGVGIGGGH